MKLIKIIKYFLLSIFIIFILTITFITIWYNTCFFPNDQEYLERISKSVKYAGKDLEEIEVDLINKTSKKNFSKPLTPKDLNYLLDPSWRAKDIYIDQNPYNSTDNSNNLKYSTGKIFYYTYQKNSLVLKNNSSLFCQLPKNKNGNRFLELRTVLPNLNLKDANQISNLKIYFTSKNKDKKLILDKNLKPEEKPKIPIFRYSNPLSALTFFLKHRGRSVLPEQTGWETIRVNLPSQAGHLEIKFSSKGEKNSYLFLGSPAIYQKKDKKKDQHLNVIYLIFDCLAKYHLDFYEHYQLFEDYSPKIAQEKLGPRKTISSSLNKYFNNICLLENMFTAGQVTRPSIVSLWTSQIYTKCRQPVFRNIVTNQNQEEFYDQGFVTLASELEKNGYFTKQISCNAQGHGVSGVGVDLGFKENYDYTLEPSELTENFKKIIEFLQENQNRKFFLYSHINTPHSPKWIPMKYFASAWWDANYNIDGAKILGNIRYLNDSLEKILNVIEKLKLSKNTLIIITADHSGSRSLYFRDNEITEKDRAKSWKKKIAGPIRREPQSVAPFASRAIYARKGSQHLLNDYMNIPWIMILPKNKKYLPGKIDSYLSKLDVAPTLLDLTTNQTNPKFSGKSFKNLLTSKKNRNKNFNNFIPLVGRFQRGFVLNGRYKYWRNILGLYKYNSRDNKKYLRQPEYLYDLQKDPDEINNLACSFSHQKLLSNFRRLYRENFTDFPDKNFIQFSPLPPSQTSLYQVQVKIPRGEIIYPNLYGNKISYSFKNKKEITFKARLKDKPLFISFETSPPNVPLEITFLKNHKKLSSQKIYTTSEKINLFKNPIKLKNKTDFYLARIDGRTGLEKDPLPPGAVYFYKIPLNYFMEMSQIQKDIKLSPGIKEVLRGWGYIQ